jgi:YD repeat-containing protein
LGLKVIYICDSSHQRIRKVGHDGIITTIAGNGIKGFSGDGSLATQASLNDPSRVTIASNGSLYFSDIGNNRIRRIDKEGIITTIAGNGIAGFSGDGGMATLASLNIPGGIALGEDGSLYIGDLGNHRVRRIDSNGIITTVAGNGTRGFSGDGREATQASLNYPSSIAVGSFGNLYIADTWNHRIRRVSPDGIITTVAGNGEQSYSTASETGDIIYIHVSGDGGLATQASIDTPFGIAVGTDDSLYITDSSNRIRRVDAYGVITTVAGNGTFDYRYGASGDLSVDGLPALQAPINTAWGVAIGPNKDLYISDVDNARIYRVSNLLPGFEDNEIAIPSEDGNELYRFDPTGRHLSTLNAFTGATLFSFSYDTQGRLSRITDGDGLITQIERDALGNPTAIVAPFGQRSTFALDSNGYLAKVTNPAGESHEMAYTVDGLLTSFKDPRGNASTFTYDALGRLLTDMNASAGGSTLSRTELADGHAVSLTSALNRLTSHSVRNLSTGDRERTHTQPDNTTSMTLEKTDGTIATTEADGTVTTLVQGPDPRFSMLAPVTQSLQISTGGLTANRTGQRTAVLVDVNNPLSLTTFTEFVTTPVPPCMTPQARPSRPPARQPGKPRQ